MTSCSAESVKLKITFPRCLELRYWLGPRGRVWVIYSQLVRIYEEWHFPEANGCVMVTGYVTVSCDLPSAFLSPFLPYSSGAHSYPDKLDLPCASGSHSWKFSLESATSTFPKICRHPPVFSQPLLKIGKSSFCSSQLNSDSHSSLNIIFSTAQYAFYSLLIDCPSHSLQNPLQTFSISTIMTLST